MLERCKTGYLPSPDQYDQELSLPVTPVGSLLQSLKCPEEFYVPLASPGCWC